MSSIWASCDLGSLWEPEVLLPCGCCAFPATYQGPRQTLGELCGILLPVDIAPRRAATVMPSSIDPDDGAIVCLYPPEGHVAFTLGADCLESGDVLVPVRSCAPAVLISEEHKLLTFSTRFIALRVLGEVDPLLIWASLTSTSGMRARSHLASRPKSRTLGYSELMRLVVPSEVPHTDRAVKLQNLLPAPALALKPGSQPRSHWRDIGIRALPWVQALTSMDESEPAEAVRLDQVATVSLSPGVPERDQLPAALPGTVPLWRADDITLGVPHAWVVPDAALDAVEEGDILIRQVGPQHRTVVARQAGVLGSGVLRVRLVSPDLADPLSYYLSSPAGRRRLRGAESGTLVPSIGVEQLGRLSVPWPPPGAPISLEGEGGSGLLQSLLEETLWS